MSTHEQIEDLRRRVSQYLASLQELVIVRNQLLQRAAEDPHPALARAVRANQMTADAVRKAVRLARAELSRLEAPGEFAPFSSCSSREGPAGRRY